MRRVGALVTVMMVWSAGGLAWAQLTAPPDPDCPEVARALQDVMRHDSRLRDWAQLSRYRDANAALGPPRGEDRVVFIGDSITDAWSHDAYGGFFPGRPYVNRGISGQTTPQMLVRFRPDVIALQPKVVVILAGTNDIAGNTGPMTNEQIQDNLATMGDLAAAHGIRVVLAGVLPVSDHHYKTGGQRQIVRRPPGRIRALNDWIRQYAREQGHVYLDYAQAVADASGMLKAEYSQDDLHPNRAGYEAMAPLAQAAIEQALRQ